MNAMDVQLREVLERIERVSAEMLRLAGKLEALCAEAARLAGEGEGVRYGSLF